MRTGLMTSRSNTRDVAKDFINTGWQTHGRRLLLPPVGRLPCCEEMKPDSDVVSLIHSRAYFERVSPGVTFRRHVLIPFGAESVVERRSLAEALSGF